MSSSLDQQQVPEGYKQTEVGLIPDDWIVKTIGELTTDVGDGIHSTPVYSSSGAYYFVNGNNIVNGSIKISGDTKRVDEAEFKKHKKSLSLRTIFLSINGTIGNLAFYNNESLVLGKSAAYMNVKEHHSLEYVYYGLQTKSTSDFFADGLTGSTIKNLGLGVIRGTPILMPACEKEQTAIANALSDVDALITSLEKLIAKKRAIKTATMQQLLTGKIRLPPFGQAHTGYKQTELGEIPEDWDVKSVFQISGETKSQFDDGDWVEAEHITDRGVRLIQTGNIGIGTFVEKSTRKYIYEESFTKLKCKELFEGDLLICRLAEPAGRACILPKLDQDKVITSVDVTICRPNQSEVSRQFLMHYFSTSQWFRSVLEHVGGTTHKRISRGALGEVLVPLPNFDEQVRISSILCNMDQDIEMLEQRLVKTQQLKQGMMQELLTGRTRLVTS